jgi:hypothetical protein
MTKVLASMPSIIKTFIKHPLSKPDMLIYRPKHRYIGHNIGLMCHRCQQPKISTPSTSTFRDIKPISTSTVQNITTINIDKIHLIPSLSSGCWPTVDVVVPSGQRNATIGNVVGGRHAAVTNVGVGWWHAPSSGIGGLLVYDVPCVSRLRAPTNGGHENACRRGPDLRALGVLSPPRGECYTCAPCSIRFVAFKWRSNIARHTNMLIIGNDPSTHADHRQARQIVTCAPALFSLCASDAHSLSYAC